MPRFKLTIEYDGTPFVGWQRQDNGPSVQGVLEAAVRGYCQVDALVQGAGRTDAGVHALGQVAHVDLPRDDRPEVVANALNAHLRPHPVAVLKAEKVSEEFHARFSATERAYVYRIINRRAPAVLEINHAWWVSVPLNAAAMHAAAQVFIGKHDFSSFRAAECQADSPVKTLDEMTVSQEGDLISITTRARSFLHHQVRNFVGTLKFVGEGKWTAADVKRVLEARDRAAAGPTAPPDGLYLTHVKYGG
ncbi:MAG: tRNA pseudouridine(38-40) synthase TruA [Rhodospirillaceae bacterium]|nr:tRNA pseudouridine(38-40) synthase TruA [Rhodospirillaceae bacterium]